MEPQLLKVIQIFADECSKMEVKRAGSGLAIRISVTGRGRWDDEKASPKITLQAEFYDGKTHQTVHGSSLGRVMDEVYRRAGFEDREAMRVDEIEKGLTALPAPTFKME